MDFKRTLIITHPVEVVWIAMRDEMPHVVDLLKEIESIDVKAYELQDSDNVVVTKVWTAAPELPRFVANYIKPGMLSWTEYGEWIQADQLCNWTIQSHAFKNAIHCNGVTKFEPAIGGKGTKTTFSGSIEIDLEQLSDEFKLAKSMSTQVIELIAQSIIPRNFAEVTKAIGRYLDLKRTDL